MLTVEELIAILKRYPQKSFIGVRADDNRNNELQGIVFAVERFDPKASFDPAYCKNVKVVLNI